MAYEQDGSVRSYPAGADLSAHQWKGVVLDAAATVQLATTAGGRIDGVLQDPVVAGQGATFKIRDISRVLAGASFAAGALLAVQADGRFAAATAGQHIVAKARQAGAAGRIVSAELGYFGTA